MKRSTHFPRLVLAAVTVAVTVGCGSSGPPRFALNGEVSLGEELVPAGHILFEPDTSKGNSGPGTRVEIREGRFTLRAAKGHVGGPHKLRLTLYDANADPNPMSPEGGAVLVDYVVERDLPAENGKLNLSLLPLAEIEARTGAPK